MELLVPVAAFGCVLLATTWLAERLRVSAPLLLMLVGVLGSVLPFVAEPVLSPDLVLVGLLPPLLYAAAVNTSLVDFKDNLGAIGWLSVGLVVFTTFGVAVVVWAVLKVPFVAACAIGAVVAPPDAVAASAVARQVGLPRRVVTVLEGESLVNDASALVALRSALLALTTTVTAAGILLDFGRAVALAVVIGYAVARLAGLAYRFIDDASPVMSTALSFLVPFLAYAPTEEVHGSGVLAVVVAGLVLGHRAQIEQDARTRIVQRTNWATIQFILENAVFLLIGLQARRIVTEATTAGFGAGTVVGVCLAALVAVIVLRMLWLLATRLVLRGRRWGRMSLREVLVVSWAGMRGVVTLAAALSLPTDLTGRPVLILVALVVTIGTLLVQGLSLPWLARRLEVHGPDPREDAIQEATVIQRASAAGLAAAQAAARPGDEAILGELRTDSNRRVNASWERLGRPSDELETPAQARHRLRLAAIEAERDHVLALRGDGQIDQEVLTGVLGALDLEESIVRGFGNRAERLQTSELTVRARDEPCGHLREAREHEAYPRPSGDTCGDCAAEGTVPVHLRMCLTCGNVGCCDSSPGLHATRHFETTGHPVMRSFEPGEAWRWCYVDEVLGE